MTYQVLQLIRAERAWLLEACCYALAIAVILTIGSANLYLPFGPDQAVFFYGAKALDQGAHYYVDYWDNKQPGLYLFYLLAGRAFGSSEFGIHLLELLWMLVFALVLMVSLRGAFRQPWLSALVPVATIGVYYGLAGENELTQLEFLVALPLFLQVLCLLGAQRHPRALPALYFASGLLAGVAVLFKLLLAPLCVGLWLIVLLYQYRANGLGLAALALRAVLPASAGVVLALGSVVLVYASWGHIDELLWTTFVYPPEAIATSPPASRTRLVSAATFFLSAFAPWAPFALFAAVAWTWRRRDLLNALMLGWFIIGIGLFLVQRFSWWDYHTLLVIFPAGLLAVSGIDRLSAWLGEEKAKSGGVARAPLIAGLLALTATAALAGPLAQKAKPLLSVAVNRFAGIDRYQTQPRVSEHYGRLRLGVQFLAEPSALPGPIYAFGNAMVYEFSGRRSPHATAGSSWEFYVPAQIDDLLATLDEQQVPYIFVDRFDMKVFRLRPNIAAYLRAHYVRNHADPSGIWFRRRNLTR
jgi:hypothetical protein